MGLARRARGELVDLDWPLIDAAEDALGLLERDPHAGHRCAADFADCARCTSARTESSTSSATLTRPSAWPPSAIASSHTARTRASRRFSPRSRSWPRSGDADIEEWPGNRGTPRQHDVEPVPELRPGPPPAVARRDPPRGAEDAAQAVPLRNASHGLAAPSRFSASTVSSTVTIRVAVEVRVCEADREPARSLITAVLSEGEKAYGKLDADELPSATPAEMIPPDGVFLVVYEQDRPLACGGLRRLNSETVEVKRMYVVPEARGRGLGRSLLASLEEQARRLG